MNDPPRVRDADSQDAEPGEVGYLIVDGHRLHGQRGMIVPMIQTRFRGLGG